MCTAGTGRISASRAGHPCRIARAALARGVRLSHLVERHVERRQQVRELVWKLDLGLLGQPFDIREIQSIARAAPREDPEAALADRMDSE